MMRTGKIITELALTAFLASCASGYLSRQDAMNRFMHRGTDAKGNIALIVTASDDKGLEELAAEVKIALNDKAAYAEMKKQYDESDLVFKGSYDKRMSNIYLFKDNNVFMFKGRVYPKGEKIQAEAISIYNSVPAFHNELACFARGEEVIVFAKSTLQPPTKISLVGCFPADKAHNTLLDKIIKEHDRFIMY